ncbi:MAG: flagellar filament capping protein FliD [Desulfovibrio sp.]
MADYTSGQISFSGLGNGTDFGQLIEGMIEVEKTHSKRLLNWKKTWTDKVQEFRNLNTKMLELKSSMEKIDTMDEFMVKKASTTSDILSLSANSKALEGTHTVRIGQLASNDILMTSSGAAELDTAVFTAETDFTYSYAGETYTISNVPADTSMQQLVNIINNNSEANGKIKASTMYDGSTYHLQITGMDLGADNQVEVLTNDPNFTLSGQFLNTVNAQNAKLKVDGFPTEADKWIERDSNTIDDVIQGVTMNLKESDPTNDIKITVDTDRDKIKENIEDFVKNVNEVRKMIKDMSDVKSNEDTVEENDNTGNSTANVKSSVSGSILTGNYGIDIIDQQLNNIMASAGVGFKPYNDDGGVITGDYYSALSQIGIKTDANNAASSAGYLVIDYQGQNFNGEFFGGLDQALKDHPEDVAKLFATNTGVSESSDFSYVSHIKSATKAGEYKISVESDGSQITKAYINGQEASINTNTWEITGKPGTDAAGLAIKVNNRSAGTHDGNVYLQQGKASETVDKLIELTNGETGPLAILEDNYGDIQESINSKLKYEEQRLTRLERTWKNKYARLDALLGTYNTQQQAVAAQLSQLSKQ